MNSTLQGGVAVDVSPLRGILFGGSRHKLSVDVRVQPLE
jgi:hypothetical protein